MTPDALRARLTDDVIDDAIDASVTGSYDGFRAVLLAALTEEPTPVNVCCTWSGWLALGHAGPCLPKGPGPALTEGREFVFSCPHCGTPSGQTVEWSVDVHSGATYHCVDCGGEVIFTAQTPAQYVAAVAPETPQEDRRLRFACGCILIAYWHHLPTSCSEHGAPLVAAEGPAPETPQLGEIRDGWVCGLQVYDRGPNDPPGNCLAWFCQLCGQRQGTPHHKTCPLAPETPPAVTSTRKLTVKSRQSPSP